MYNDDDTIAETGTTYKGVASNFPLVLETEKLQAAKKGAAYSQTIAVCGGTGDYTFTASGLPTAAPQAGAKRAPTPSH